MPGFIDSSVPIEHTKILGVDPSMNSTGFYELIMMPDGSTFPGQSGIIKPKTKDNARLVEAGNIFHRLLTLIRPALIVYEGYSYGSRFGHLFQIGEIGGVYRYFMHKMGYVEKKNLFICAPKTLKKFVATGNADKQAMQDAVKKRWGILIPQNDIADAYCLARVGVTLMHKKPWTKLERTTVKVLRSVKKSKRG